MKKACTIAIVVVLGTISHLFAFSIGVATVDPEPRIVHEFRLPDNPNCGCDCCDCDPCDCEACDCCKGRK